MNKILKGVGSVTTLTKQDTDSIINLLESIKRKNMVAVELGSWKGYSSSVIMSVIKDINGKLYCVDHFKGNPDTRDENVDTYKEFEMNMKSLGYRNEEKENK